MKPILVTQRVMLQGPGPERRDALAQDWPRFLAAAGLLPLPVPNELAAARACAQTLPWQGLLLTGGNDLASLGGDAPERDAVENWLLEEALALGRPVLGVCRGMQVLLERFGAALLPVPGHAGRDHPVTASGGERRVNSFHHFGCRDCPPELEVWARAPDGVVEGVRHRALPLVGLMWHPERLRPADTRDLALFAEHFAAPTAGQGTSASGSAPCAG